MNELPIFTAALELESPWFLEAVYFKDEADGRKVLHLEVDHERRVKFEYEGELCPVYDHQERTWKHLNFFQHECYLHARVPRVQTPDGAVKLVEVPWAKPGSSFTLLFERRVLGLMRAGLSNSVAGARLGISGKRVFGIVRRHVSVALSEQDLEPVEELSVDETSRARGHSYLTILCDRVGRKVVGVAPGKDQEAFAHALIDMEVRGADRRCVRTVTLDMSKAYISGVAEHLPDADMVFDRFHIAKQLNEAVDEIRRTEQRQYQALKKSRYLWLKSSAKLSEAQQERVQTLAEAYPTIGLAYRLKELLKSVLDDARHSADLQPLEAWMEQAWNSNLEPIRDFVRMLCNHWYGIEAYFKKVANNAFAERVNLKIQEIKRLARGYRNVHNLVLMIYFHLGGLQIETH